MIVLGRKMYTPQELAEIFKVSQITIYRWIDTEMLPAQKVGKRWLIQRSEVEKLVFGEIGKEGGEYEE
jgi:excisionase family DNA binding protein